MLDDLLARFARRDRLALARLLSLTARGENGAEIVARLGPPAKPARVVAVTGSAGVGKSTLVGKLIERFRAGGQTVAVLACDPQSPLTGGALLGDRFRMPGNPDDGVFIRSLAAVGGHGALAEHLPDMIRLLEAFGFDLVLIETVGAGQGDTAARSLADVVVLLLQPETGDELQWEKAGVLEVADLVVIHKADLPGADHVEAQVRSALMPLTEGPTVPVLRVSARTGAGLDALVAAINAFPLRRQASPNGSDTLLRLAQDLLAARFRTAAVGGNEEIGRLMNAWQQHQISADEAAAGLVRLLLDDFRR